MMTISSHRKRWVNTLGPRQNGRHLADDVFKCILLNENVWISIKNSLKFVPMGPIDNKPALVQIMAWRRSGDKPLSEPMFVSLATHICVTRPPWVKTYCGIVIWAIIGSGDGFPLVRCHCTLNPGDANGFAACDGGIRVSWCSHVSFKLIWNGLHGRCIIQTHLDTFYQHTFYVCASWDTQALSLRNYCGFNSRSYCTDACGYHQCPQTLAEICRNMGICCGFRGVATGR